MSAPAASSPPSQYDLAGLTCAEFGRLVADARPLVVLVPVGSVEPHGPHLSLVTDTVISRGAAERAAPRLERAGALARVAPAVPYGVTECAAGFAGAVSLPADVLTAYLGAVVAGFLATGVDHVCLVNNHLEPAHDLAVRQAVRQAVHAVDEAQGEGHGERRASVACPLTRRWARTLSAEFKSGACHAGQYETSIMMAEAPALVREDVRAGLAEVPISLSEALRAGVSDFKDMGLREAYAGAPARATAEEGEHMLDRLAEMIVTEVAERLGLPA